MKEATAILGKEELRKHIADVGRGEAPALEASKPLLGALEFEKIKEASKDKSLKDTIKDMGKRSRMEKIDEALFKLGAMKVMWEINLGVEKASSELQKWAHDTESTFFTKQGTGRSIAERLQDDLVEIFEIK
jgi:hypothetical protein